MGWPVNSPDLSPIENVWSYFKYHLDQYENDPKDLDDLWDRVQDIWNMIPVEYLRGLYESMPKRMQSLYRNRGGRIAY
jgi:RNAse (barnase) inhibitor barstar